MSSHGRLRGGLDRREFVKRTAALGLSLPTASALLAACAGESETLATSTSLKIRLVGDITTLDPAFFGNTSVDEPIMQSVYEGLVTYKPHAAGFEVVNQLAESLRPSADGLSHDFKLKQGVLFHGGYGEVTAEDVKYSYERIAGLTEPKLNAPYEGDWKSLKEVKVKDKYSGTIILKEPFAALMHSTMPVTSGFVLSKKAVEERGKKYGTSPIGTGPFEFAKWTPKQEIRLKRFADYGTGFAAPEWTEIVFRPIPDDSAADIALENGEVDFGQISLQSVGRFEGNEKFKTQFGPTLGYTWIGMNVLSPKLEDMNVRRAIRAAIDVPAITAAAFEGRWTPATGIIPPEMGVGYWPDAPTYERDVDKARSLLQKAGVDSLDLKFSYTEEPGTDSVAEIAQANLAEIGIKLTLDKQDSGTYYDIGKQLRERELFYVDYETSADPSFSTVWFVCEQFDQWNWMYWCDKEYDRLHYAALEELDEEKRTALYIEMQKRWDEAAHTVWIAWPTRYYSYRANLEPAVTPASRVLAYAFTQS